VGYQWCFDILAYSSSPITGNDIRYNRCVPFEIGSNLVSICGSGLYQDGRYERS